MHPRPWESKPSPPFFPSSSALLNPPKQLFYPPLGFSPSENLRKAVNFSCRNMHPCAHKARSYFRGTGAPGDHRCMLQLAVLLPGLTQGGWPSAARSTSCTGGKPARGCEDALEAPRVSLTQPGDQVESEGCSASCPNRSLQGPPLLSPFPTAAEKVRLDREWRLLGRVVGQVCPLS